MPKNRLSGYWLFVTELAEQHGVTPCQMDKTADPLWVGMPDETQNLYKHRAKLMRGPPRPCQRPDCTKLKNEYIAYVNKTQETVKDVKKEVRKLEEEHMDLLIDTENKTQIIAQLRKPKYELPLPPAIQVVKFPCENRSKFLPIVISDTEDEEEEPCRFYRNSTKKTPSPSDSPSTSRTTTPEMQKPAEPEARAASPASTVDLNDYVCISPSAPEEWWDN